MQTSETEQTAADRGHSVRCDEGEMEHPPYDEETFERAVTRGLDSRGDVFDTAMPRWRTSEQDLDDLIVFLKTLQ